MLDFSMLGVNLLILLSFEHPPPPADLD